MFARSLFSRALPLCTAAMLIGCAGGGVGEQNDPAPAEGAEFTFGTLSGRAASTNPPLTTNSDEIAATALTGIVTSLRLQDQEVNAAELRVVFSGRLFSNDFELYSCNLDGSDLVRITNTPGIQELQPVASPDGTKIAFRATGIGGDNEIFLMDIDGGNRIALTANDKSDLAPNWSPDGKWVVFETFEGGSVFSINRVNVETKAILTVLNDSMDNRGPAFSADGQSIVFSGERGFSHSRLFSVPVNGGSVSGLRSDPDLALSAPKMSPDGLYVAFIAAPLTEEDALVAFSPINGLMTVRDSAALFPNWSPDSKEFVYYLFDPAQNIGRIYFAGVDAAGVRELLPNVRGSMIYPSYVPPPKEPVFVGPGRMFGSRLAGFIVAQDGPTTRGLLGFDAATPLSAVVTKQTPNDTTSPNLVFSIDADTVTQITFAHAPYWNPVRVVGHQAPLAAADGALVSIDSQTGKVVAVLPFAGLRSKPAVTDQAGERVFTGNFLGVFDSTGSNLAEQGASEVRVDLQSGKVTVF